MIGLIAAMPVEAEHLISQLKDTKVVLIGRQEYRMGTLVGCKVVISVSGLGKVNSALCAAAMIQHFQPKCIINFGVAGSTDPLIGVRDLVVAKGTVQYDIDTTCLGDPPAFISSLNIQKIPVDERLSSELVKASEPMIPKVYLFEGIIATGDKFLNDVREKIWIRSQFDASAVDMETGAIAQACYMYHIPFSAVRCISDYAEDHSDSEYEASLKVSAMNAQQVILNFLDSQE